MAFSAFAVSAPGLEPLVAAELGSLGIADAAAETGGIAFQANESVLARALIHTRVATRVIVRVSEFTATSFAQLEKRAKAIDWSRWIAPGGAVSFRVTCKKSRLYHSDAVAERIAGALTARVRGARVAAGTPDEDDDAGAAQMFVVRMAHDVCTISADAAGVALHKRGYRQATAKAPLRETLAAAMLMGAEWSGEDALLDPMCGAGTIVIEAAMQARRIAPGLHRAFAAEGWPHATRDAWRVVREEATAVVLPAAPSPLAGSDRDEGAIVAARANAERAGVASDVQFAVLPVSAATAPAPRGLLITNPPYGVRVGETAALRDLYAQFGKVARSKFRGWRCALLSADQSRGHVLERQIGLALRPAWKSSNGGIPVRLITGDIPR